jgi:acyl-CoA synthetase (AMP-forming)/AMP-acid ligase II
MAGATAVPISYKLKKDRLEYILADCDPRFIICDQVIGSHIGMYHKTGKTTWVGGIQSNLSVGNVVPLSEIFLTSPPRVVVNDSSEHAMIIYTSGSTGVPKGILLSHSNVIFSAGSISEYLELRNSDKIINFLPPSFDYGLYQAILTLYVGAELYLIERFSFIDQIIKVINTQSISVLPLVPSIAAGIVKFLRSSPEKVLTSQGRESIRSITSTGDVFHPKHIQRLSETFPNARIFSMYGLTECKRVSYLDPSLVFQKPYCVGKPMPGVEVKIVDERMEEVAPCEEGRLLVIGENVALGYWNDPALSEQHFLVEGKTRQLLTNDIFIQDSEGLLYYQHRTDDVIKSGGYRISIREITRLLSFR